MRTRIATTLSFIVILATACSPDSTAPVQTSASSGRAPGRSASAVAASFAWMGNYHNDALAYALVKIKASRKVSKADRCQVGLSALKEFQKQYRKSGGGPTFDDLSLTDGMCEAAEATGFGLGDFDRVSAGSIKPSNDISAAASNYMDQVNAAVDYTTSSPQYSFAVNQIENAASNALGDGTLETAAVFGTGSIGVSSESYWATNEGSWSSSTPQQYTRQIAPPSAPRFDLTARQKKIIHADVAAAIGVLVYEWWTGEVAFEKACIKAAAASLIAGIYLT